VESYSLNLKEMHLKNGGNSIRELRFLMKITLQDLSVLSSGKLIEKLKTYKNSFEKKLTLKMKSKRL